MTTLGFFSLSLYKRMHLPSSFLTGHFLASTSTRVRTYSYWDHSFLVYTILGSRMNRARIPTRNDIWLQHQQWRHSVARKK